MEKRRNRIVFGDFQTPDELALNICQRLASLGIKPDVIIEPTCGTGAFIDAAARTFPGANSIFGYDINEEYLKTVREKLPSLPDPKRITLEMSDFFSTNWRDKIKQLHGSILVVGNFPWVTNAVQGAIGGTNLPIKSNFKGHNGFDAISGKSNFDISEWMLLEVIRWFEGGVGDVAMLVKTAVARKILAHAERHDTALQEAMIIGIDAKKEFGASVEAGLLIMRFSSEAKKKSHDFTVFDTFSSPHGRRMGHRQGFVVSDLDAFNTYHHLLGKSPKKWRSGIKHDAAAIMEFTLSGHHLINGLGELVDLEPKYIYPLLKGSDIANGKKQRDKFILVPQKYVGEPTEAIRLSAPRTWEYLERHAPQLDARSSTIYKNNPRFSIFGVGDYTFQPWRIAICALYKSLTFRLIAPVLGRPVMFDDTVYYLSFDTETEAAATLARLESIPVRDFLSSLIFWDEKRPIKTAILNVLDWSMLEGKSSHWRTIRNESLDSLPA